MVANILGKIGASLLAFFVAAFCGGMVAQVLAVSTGATEEFILIFVATATIAIAITVPFFIAQFFDPPRRAVDRVAVALVIAFFILLLALVLWTLSVPYEQRTSGSDFKIYAWLILPNLTTIAAHWLVMRAMQPRGPANFGRSEAQRTS